MTDIPNDAKVVIIGGGIIGLSVAYHLGKRGCNDVVLLERNELTSGTSWHAAGIVGPLRANMNLTRLAIYATSLFAKLEQETGQATGYKRTSGLYLAQDQDRLTELKRIHAMGELNGLDVEIINAKKVSAIAPHLNTVDLIGALWIEKDGQTNPVDTCHALTKGARHSGIRIIEHTRVTKIHSHNDIVHSVTTDNGTTIQCETVINCAGLWARQVGSMAGVSVPLQAVEHMYIVTESIAELPQPCPVVRDLEGRIYIKEDAGKLVIGGFEINAKLWHPSEDSDREGYLMFPEDWEQFEPFLQAGLHRVPALEQTGIQHFMNGPESFTPDTRQLMGEAPELKNYFIAAGFNSIGIMSSAGVGKVMADWVIDGTAPMDLWPVDIARADPLWNNDTFLQNRTQEAVANQFNMHWPYKQMDTGRDLRRSPLNGKFAKAGAVFGAIAGWERPLWFAHSPSEREISYSYQAQAWWPYAEREAEAVQNRVVLLELSPFSKLHITGVDAESFLQRICTNDISSKNGTVTYTLILNHNGGIEADVTIRRVSNDEFWIVGSAATRWKDLTWIRRNIHENEQVDIKDITEDYAVLGIMGPQSRELLDTLCSSDLSNSSLPFSSACDIEIDSMPIVAQRTSFVGELGYELYIPKSNATSIYDAICEAGKSFDMSHAGFYCMESCRIEKGFKHWGHDMTSEDSPSKADLNFTVDYNKHVDFIGKSALLEQTEPDRSLVLFSVPNSHPLLLHDEPIYRDGKIVGITTSGARGFRMGLSLCFGDIQLEPGQTKQDLYSSEYEIGIAGERFPLAVHKRPPYDPDGLKMRS
ncbi:MAG: FAD-dependent oxidoreductase [Gammaproteobacteria bacterium]|nr:FAD-dependent oxidoreductase [Gammaproteobacteria bacterium]